MQVDAIIGHLNQGDLAKRRVALDLLVHYLDQPNPTPPPKSIVKTLVHCLCDPGDLSRQVIAVLTKLITKWVTYAQRLVDENMCAIVMHLYWATQGDPDAKVMAGVMPVTVMYYDMIQRFFGIWHSSAGINWYPTGCLIGQLMLDVAKKMDSRTKQILEKPYNLAPALIHLFVCFKEGKDPDMHSVITDSGRSFLKKALTEYEDPLVKGMIVLGYNSIVDPQRISGPVFRIIVQYITDENTFLCIQALEFCKNCIVGSPRTELENFNLDVSKLVNILKRTEVNGGAFVASVLLQAPKFLKQFVEADGIAALMDRPSTIGFDLEDPVLLMFGTIAATEFGKDALKKGLVTQRLWQYMDDNHFPNVARAAKVLVSLGEEIDHYIDNTFIEKTRSLRMNWFEMLVDVPGEFAIKFIQTSEDLDILLAVETRHRGVEFITHLIMEFVQKPDVRSNGLLQLELIIQHPMLMSYVSYLLAMEQQELLGRRKLLCVALLSIASDKVRSRLIEGGHIKHLVNLIKLDNMPATAERVLQAISIIAFCNPAKCIQLGGATPFLDILQRKDFYRLYGVWALISGDPDFALPHFSSISKVVKDFPVTDIFAVSLKGTIESTSVKPGVTPNPSKQFSTVNARILDTCNRSLLDLASTSPTWDYQTLYTELLTCFYFVHHFSLDRFPENKNVIDFFWMCITRSTTSGYNDTKHVAAHLQSLLDHWRVFDPDSPHLRAQALLRALTIFLEAKESVYVGLEQTTWIMGYNSDNDSRFVGLKDRARDEYNKIRHHRRAATQATTSLQDEINARLHINQDIKKRVNQLKKENAKLEKLEETIVEMDIKQEMSLLQTNLRIKSLEEQLRLPPTDHMLQQFAAQSSVDPLDLLHLDNIQSLEALSALKSKMMAKTSKRKASLVREKDAHHERVVLCPICMDRPKNTCFVPCGHSMCETCSGTILSSNNNRCPICRVEVDVRQPLYF